MYKLKEPVGSKNRDKEPTSGEEKTNQKNDSAKRSA
jgi:hypothetical protein